MDLSDIVEGMKRKDDRQDGKDKHEQTRTASVASSSARASAASCSAMASAASSSASGRVSAIPAEGNNTSAFPTTSVKCDQCQRTFQSKKEFDQHCAVFHRRSTVAANRREANYQCSFCSKSFTSPSKRAIHEDTTHKGLRPFKCEICSKSFGHKGGELGN